MKRNGSFGSFVKWKRPFLYSFWQTINKDLALSSAYSYWVLSEQHQSCQCFCFFLKIFVLHSQRRPILTTIRYFFRSSFLWFEKVFLPPSGEFSSEQFLQFTENMAPVVLLTTCCLGFFYFFILGKCLRKKNMNFKSGDAIPTPLFTKFRQNFCCKLVGVLYCSSTLELTVVSFLSSSGSDSFYKAIFCF